MLADSSALFLADPVAAGTLLIAVAVSEAEGAALLPSLNCLPIPLVASGLSTVSPLCILTIASSGSTGLPVFASVPPSLVDL